MSDSYSGWPEDLADRHNEIARRAERPPSPFADPVGAIAGELLEHNVTLGGLCSCGDRLWTGLRPGTEPRALKAEHAARAIVELMRRG